MIFSYNTKSQPCEFLMWNNTQPFYCPEILCGNRSIAKVKV